MVDGLSRKLYINRGIEMKELEQVLNRKDLEKFAQFTKYIWIEEPEDIPRISQKISGRTQRLKQLGNSIVPQIPEFIGTCILNYEQVKNRREL